jgi:hypothetical protein
MGMTLEAVRIHDQEVTCRMTESSAFAVSRVGQLRMIAEKIEPVLLGMTPGATGYLDDRVMPTDPVMKGVDVHGRIFVTLCLRVTLDTTVAFDGVITVFQRYSDDDKIVVQACNSRQAVRLIEGAATEADMSRLQELITAGKVSEPADAGGRLFKLVSPAKALQAPKA